MSSARVMFGWLVAVSLLAANQLSAQPPDDIDVIDPDQQPISLPFLPPSGPPHLVIEAPRPPRHNQINEEWIVDDAGVVQPSNGSPQPKPHGDLHDKVAEHFLHADKTPRPVAIPNAARTPVWKTPYSYGHFGASRNRQWSLHYGHQETYTQWTLR